MTHNWDEAEPDPNQVTVPERALVLPGGQLNIKLTRGAKALSCKRSEESHRELRVWPTQELGPDCHPLFLTYGSSKEGQPSMRCLLLPTSMDACAASQHGHSVTGFGLCYLASPSGTPVGNLSGCSLFLFSVPHERLIMTQPSRQSSSVSLPSIPSFPALLERLLAASLFLCSPRGKSGFILESHAETWHLSSSVTALPSSLIMISSLSAPEHLVLLI